MMIILTCTIDDRSLLEAESLHLMLLSVRFTTETRPTVGLTEDRGFGVGTLSCTSTFFPF
jgi:hypothetical protein